MLEYKEYIYSVYRNRSFSRAAEELHISQPWLSAAIKKAEQELQLKLFDRTTNPVSLTEAGRFYIEQIEQMLDAIAEIEGLERIRFTAPHPKGYGKDLVEAYGRIPKLCESAHIPVQSG